MQSWLDIPPTSTHTRRGRAVVAAKKLSCDDAGKQLQHLAAEIEAERSNAESRTDSDDSFSDDAPIARDSLGRP